MDPVNWSKLESQAPEIADFGKARLHNKVAFLATTRADGSPRVHPFTPIIGEGHFFVFMEPDSPKGNDLRRDGRFAVHCSILDTNGESGEFMVSGRGRIIEDPELRALAVRIAPYTAAERYILFELEPENVLMTEYRDGQAIRTRWKTDEIRK
jgi:hypothetical protein